MKTCKSETPNGCKLSDDYWPWTSVECENKRAGQ